MTEAEELDQRAREMPYGTERAAIHRRAVELADAAGDLDVAFGIRMGHVTSAAYGGDPMGALAGFAWCRAHLDEDPARFAQHDYLVNWVHKWMPLKAASFPTVSLERIDAIVDDLERRHVASGSGRRSALALRLNVALFIGKPRDHIAELLSDWRSTARGSLSDCRACEATFEMESLEYLNAPPLEILAPAEPYLRGDLQFCSDGPGEMYLVALRALIDSGQLDRARDLLWKLVRETEHKGERSRNPRHTANLLAAVGEYERALALGIRQLVHLAAPPSPHDEMFSAAALAGAFSLAHASGVVDREVRLPDHRPGYLADHPTIIDLSELAGLLRQRAEDLAAEFDRRNGTRLASTEVEQLAERRPLPTIVMDAPTATETLDVPTTQTAEHPTPAPAPAPALAPAPVGDPNAALPADLTDPPADACGLDGWARTMMAAWHRIPVEEAMAPFIDDPELDPHRWVVAALWLTNPGDPDPLERLAASATDDSLPLAVRARAAARVAHSTAMTRSSDPAAAVDVVLALIADLDADDPNEHLALVNSWRALAETRAHLADPQRSAQALDRAHSLLTPSTVDEVHHGVAHSALAIVGHGLDVHGLGVPEAGTDLDAIADVVASAVELVRARPHGSSAASLAYQAGTRALDVGLADLAVAGATLAVDLIPRNGEPDVLGFRFTALLLLADARGMADGPAAALEVQREVVEVARALGGGHPLGWARRGLAFQLQALGRFDEASVLLAEAAELLADADDLVEACALDIRQGWLELDMSEAERADRAATRAAGRLPDLPDEVRPWLESDIEELAATCAERRGDWSSAAAAWERVADLAPALERAAAGFRAWAAVCNMEAGDRDAALRLIAQAEAEIDAAPDEEQPWLRARIESRRADLHAQMDQLGDAVESYARAAEGFRAAGDMTAAASTALGSARASYDHLGAEAAIPRFEAALAMALHLDDPQVAASVRQGLAGALEETGRFEEAALHRRLAEEWTE